MHDALGKELQKGDIVMIPAVVAELFSEEDYCNVILQTVLGRRPDGKQEYLGSINSGVLYRANKNDVLDLGLVYGEKEN